MTLIEQSRNPAGLAGQEGYVPAAVVEVEVSGTIPALAALAPDGSPRDRAWVLVRVFDEPLGTMTLPIEGAGSTSETVAAAIDAEFGPVIRERAAAAGVELPGALPTCGFDTRLPPPHRARREAALRTAPGITVVISTRDRLTALTRCVEAVLAQRYPRLQVVIVDNAPSTDDTRAWARTITDDRVEYVLEPRPGLSWARNRGISRAHGQIVAFIDDDEVPDPFWLAEIARAFAARPEADAVSGMIVPAEFETPAQDMFESYGGHSKGRGFTPAVFSPHTAHEQSPMYPLPPFGTGGNMAFRRRFFAEAGMFDVALGAGTATKGGEDTEILTRVLLRGGTICYEPAALVWHYHRRTWQGLYDIMRGYGIGLTAYYTSLLLDDPRRVVALTRLLPTAVRDMFTRQGRGLGEVADDFPKELVAAKRRGMLAGPYQYLRSRARARRLARRS